MINKPGPVPLARWRSSIWAGGCPTALATQPGRFSGPLHPFPIRSCSGWGLPSRPVTRPLVRSYRTVASLPAEAGGLHFCGTGPKVALAGRYPAPCPVEPGLSSTASKCGRDRLFYSQPKSAGIAIRGLLFGVIGYHNRCDWSNPDHRTHHLVKIPAGAFFFASFNKLLQHGVDLIRIMDDDRFPRGATDRRAFFPFSMVGKNNVNQ